MSYHAALGAGPGTVRTYKVDLPFPWGENTEIKIPLQAMVYDAVNSAWPNLRGRIDQAVPELTRSFLAEMEPAIQRVEKKMNFALWTAWILGGGALAALGYYVIKNKGFS